MSDKSNNMSDRYKVVHEDQSSALLRVEWVGDGRDAESGDKIDLAKTDPRRKLYVSINFMSKAPMPWRSNLDRGLQIGELTLSDLTIESLEKIPLTRTYISKKRHLGDFFFRAGSKENLTSANYVAQCSTLLSLNGAIECSAQLDLASFAVKIDFDRAFLWDFDRFMREVSAVVNDYVALHSTKRLIDSIP